MPKKDRTMIFDDTYRTILQKMPWFVIPLINLMFGTDYDLDVDSVQLRNEHLKVGKKTITDSLFRIGDKFYHLECQSKSDHTMAIRMFDYDLQIAMEHPEDDSGRYRIKFPFAGVLFLREPEDMPDKLEVDIEFSDGQTVTYHVPVQKSQALSLDEIFQKHLLILLPFYILRYENRLKKAGDDKELKATILAEAKDIVTRLQTGLDSGKRYEVFADLVHLIRDVSEHVLRDRKDIQEGVESIMGGKVLELYSERIKKDSEKRGIQKGQRGMIISLLAQHTPIDVIEKASGWSRESILALQGTSAN